MCVCVCFVRGRWGVGQPSCRLLARALLVAYFLADRLRPSFPHSTGSAFPSARPPAAQTGSCPHNLLPRGPPLLWPPSMAQAASKRATTRTCRSVRVRSVPGVWLHPFCSGCFVTWSHLMRCTLVMHATVWLVVSSSSSLWWRGTGLLEFERVCPFLGELHEPAACHAVLLRWRFCGRCVVAWLHNTADTLRAGGNEMFQLARRFVDDGMHAPVLLFQATPVGRWVCTTPPTSWAPRMS